MLKLYKFFPLIFLAACTLGPDYERPMFWNNQTIAKSLGVNNGTEPVGIYWYRLFNDEVLNKLIEEALSNNTNVKMALSRLHQARYQLKINNVAYWPMFDVKGQYNYAYAPKYEKLGVKTDYFYAGLDMSWEIDIWGAGRRQTEGSYALYQAAANNLSNVLLSLTAEVANNYILLRTTQEQIRIAKNNLRLQQDIFLTVNSKYKTGLTDVAALNQAEFAVQTTKALIPDLEYKEAAYRHSIAVLLGLLPEDMNELKTQGHNLTSVTFNPSRLAEFPIEVIRLRPDIRVAESRLVAKNAEVGQAVAAMFPNVNLAGALGWQASQITNMGNSEYAAYGYQPTINLPFLHWGQQINQIKLSKAVKKEYIYAYKNTLQKAVEEIKNSMVAVRKETERNKALAKSVINMEKVLSAMKTKYKRGLIEFSDLLATEQNLLTAQNNLAVSKGATYQNIVSFYKAIGGGYY